MWPTVGQEHPWSGGCQKLSHLEQHFSGMGLGPLPQVCQGKYKYKKQAPETYSDFLDLNLRWLELGDLHFNISPLFLGARVKAPALGPWRVGSEPGWGSQ